MSDIELDIVTVGEQGPSGPQGIPGSDAEVTQSNMENAITDKGGWRSAENDDITHASDGAAVAAGLNPGDVYYSGTKLRAVPAVGRIVLRKPDGTVRLFEPAANTDVARGDALSAAWAAATTGSRLNIGPGNYLMRVTFNQLVEGVTYQFHGAYLYIDGASTAPIGGAQANWLFYSRTAGEGGEAHNWKFLGPVTLDGAGLSGKVGLVQQNGNNRVIRDVWFKRWATHGLWAYSGWTPTSGWGNRIESCMAENCGVGFEAVGAEYLHWSNCVARNNTTGFQIDCGNNYFVNCVAAYNTTGVRITPGTNPGHGSWVGGSINHNTTTAVRCDASMSMGFQFVGTHIYANGTPGIQLLGDNMNFIGCGIDSVITPSTTAGVKNYFINCFFPLVNETGPEYDTAIAAWTTDQRSNTKFRGCTAETGNWPHNDNLTYVFADQAAAVSGGLVAGDEYRSADGLLRVVTP